ncbi:MAG: hypothetical protein AAGF74_04655 [Pseudomonadota bacterium]
MDLTVLAFYALLCGLVSVLAPNIGGWMNRFGVGAIVGALAAAALPALRSMLGL